MPAMPLGPVELLVVSFPGNQFKGEIAPALRDLVDSGTIRIIDLLFIQKAADGTVTEVELDNLDEASFLALDPLVEEVSGMISDDDVMKLAEGVPPNSSVAALLFENTWATRFVEAMRRANGQLELNERIPRQVIEEALRAKEAAPPPPPTEAEAGPHMEATF
jgi:uncharacterized protein DUF6325